MRKLVFAFSFGLFLVIWTTAAQGASVPPELWLGWPDCSDVCSTCGYYECTVYWPIGGTSSGPEGFQVTISNVTWSNSQRKWRFDWNSNYPVYTVIVQGAVRANVYNYSKYASPVMSDTCLESPGPVILWVIFCYNPPEVTVTVSGLSDLSVDQKFISQGKQYGSLGTLSVSITANVSYSASVYYTYTILSGSTSPFTGDPLSLKANSGIWYTIPEHPSFMILPDFSGNPGTESHNYPVRVDLSLLGDRDAGDVIQFTVYVTVSASSP